MSSYIHFTEEQIYRANSVNLENYLNLQGEKLIPSGRDKRLASDHSITIRGNTWYDHAAEEGGLAIDFLQKTRGLTFPESVVRLLGGEAGIVYEQIKKESFQERKPFALPAEHTDMRRVYAYLMKARFIDRDIISQFAREKLIYESCEKMKNKQGEMREYHNAVFVGYDENGVPRHAHKRGLHTEGGYKGNVDSSNPAYSFHRVGTSGRIYVFEAPIDLLSFVTLYPQNWQEHSYVALCGTAEHAILKTLEQNQHLQNVVLCLDHDEAGIEAAGRLTEILNEHGYNNVAELFPKHKDWNESIKALNGLEVIPAEDHPQLLVSPAICERVAHLSCSMPKPFNPERQFENLLKSYEKNLRLGQIGKAAEYIEGLASLALYETAREHRQMGKEFSAEERSVLLHSGIHPHQNRGKIQNRLSDLGQKINTALSLHQTDGVRTPEQKERQSSAYLDIALHCVKDLVRIQADEMKLEQKNSEISMEVLS